MMKLTMTVFAISPSRLRMKLERMWIIAIVAIVLYCTIVLVYVAGGRGGVKH